METREKRTFFSLRGYYYFRWNGIGHRARAKSEEKYYFHQKLISTKGRKKKKILTPIEKWDFLLTEISTSHFFSPLFFPRNILNCKIRNKGKSFRSVENSKKKIPLHLGLRLTIELNLPRDTLN